MITLVLVPCLYDVKDTVAEKLSFLRSTDDRGVGEENEEVGAAE